VNKGNELERGQCKTPAAPEDFWFK